MKKTVLRSSLSLLLFTVACNGESTTNELMPPLVPKELPEAVEIQNTQVMDTANKVRFGRKRDRIKQRDLPDKDEKSGKIMLGREYYYALLDKAVERRWALPLTFHYTFADKAFNYNCQQTNLSSLTFGAPFRVRDVFLLSRLADDNKTRIFNGDALSKDRPEPGIPQNSAFGSYASDQYITLVAPTIIGFNAQSSEANAILSALYRFDIACDGAVVGVVGTQIPVRSISHKLDIQLHDGTLFRQGLLAPPNNIARENSLNQFYRDFVSIEDFFINAVLRSKGIEYQPDQRAVGLGDLELFGLVDLAGLMKHVDGFQVGLNVTFPTGARGSVNKLWAPDFGSGVYQFDLLFNTIFNSPSPVFNPMIKLVGSWSTRRGTGYGNNGIRVPQVISNSSRKQIREVPILANEDAFLGNTGNRRFQGYYVDAFTALDSSVPAFANSVVNANVKLGSKVLVGIGNYFFDAFSLLGFRLGLFYDYMKKKQDSICIGCPADATFDVAALIAATEQQAHTVGFNLTYKFRNMLELNIGSQHVIAGRNVAREHDIFASIIAIF